MILYLLASLVVGFVIGVMVENHFFTQPTRKLLHRAIEEGTKVIDLSKELIKIAEDMEKKLPVESPVQKVRKGS